MSVDCGVHLVSGRPGGEDTPPDQPCQIRLGYVYVGTQSGMVTSFILRSASKSPPLCTQGCCGVEGQSYGGLLKARWSQVAACACVLTVRLDATANDTARSGKGNPSTDDA